MATSIGCRHVGGERIADGIGEFRCRYWCMYFIVRDPIRINTPSQQCLNWIRMNQN